jgi:hypothetical protein
MVVGISPGLSLDEHVQKYPSPTEGFDVLIKTGGIADAIADLVALIREKPTGAVVLYDDNPGRLIDRLVEYYRAEHCKRPNCFCQPALISAS